LAHGDVETLCGESRTQGVRHNFGVAKVAHGLILRLNDAGVPGLALLTRSFGQRVTKAAIRSPYPEGRKQQVVSTCKKDGLLPGLGQSLVARSPMHFDVRFGSKADIASINTMSALPPKADIVQLDRDVRFVPKELPHEPKSSLQPQRGNNHDDADRRDVPDDRTRQLQVLAYAALLDMEALWVTTMRHVTGYALGQRPASRATGHFGTTVGQDDCSWSLAFCAAFLSSSKVFCCCAVG
jgi:hypothetical protein